MEREQLVAMSAYNAAYLDLVALKYGGETTVNELRVMNCVIRSYFAGKDIGVSFVSRELGIPKSTVSRAAVNLRSKGWISEEVSNVDGRKRFLRLTSKVWERFENERKLLQAHWRQAA